MSGQVWAVPLRAVFVVCAALCALGFDAGQGRQGQRPVFRAATDLVLIEAIVVSRDGTPVHGLKADQFDVFLDGRRRPVIAADFVGTTTAAAAIPGASASSVTAALSDERVVLLAVDQGSFPMVAQHSAREVVRRVLDKVAPEDYLGLVSFPFGMSIAPSRDRRLIREAIGGLVGLRIDGPMTRFNLSAVEAMALRAREPVTTAQVVARECRGPDPTCPQELRQDAAAIAIALEQQSTLSLSGLHGIMDAMAGLAGRKTLLLVSAGLPMSNRPGSHNDLTAATEALARRAAAANLNLYVLFMNVHFLRAFSPEYGKRNHTLFEDIGMFGSGLERVADSAGGSFFQVEVDADPFIDRALRETTAYYVLAVQPEPQQHDGKEHFIRVTVKQRGATVRYRRVVTIPGTEGGPRPPGGSPTPIAAGGRGQPERLVHRWNRPVF